MCPFCFASAAYAVAGTVSTGGLAALAVRMYRRKSTRDNTRTNLVRGVINMSASTITNPQIVSRDEWLIARKQLLAREKQLTRERDAVAAERRRLPWVKVDKAYAFDAPGGKQSLSDLFEGKSQLIVYHFMLAP